MRHWQRWGVKLPGQCTRPQGVVNREATHPLQASRGGEARLDGMANPGEPMLNLVKPKGPKMLCRPLPKWYAAGGAVVQSVPADIIAAGEESEPNPSGQNEKRGKPVAPPVNRQANRKERPRGCGYEMPEQANVAL